VLPLTGLVCWPRLEYPGVLAVKAWFEPWPARKPTARSPAPVGVAKPESGPVPVFANPADTSSGSLPKPLNSWTWIAIPVAVPTLAVTEVTGAAPAVYQSSPSE